MATPLAPLRPFSSLVATVAACLALAVTACGLELTPRDALHTNIDISKNANTTTANVTGTINGQAVAFNYVLLNTSSNGTTALEFLSYDPCLWAESHNTSTFPQNFNTLIVELVSVNSAPGPGVYTDVSGAGNNSSSTTIDPSSSFGSISACVGTWTALSAGSEVTLTSINTASSSAVGTIHAELEGGGLLSGSFNTTACNLATTFAGNGEDSCSSLQ